MLSVVCWKWTPPDTYERKFEARHVNILRSMVARHYHRRFEFICFTDNPRGIDPSIRIRPISDDFSTLESPLGKHYPSCYRRLRAFKPDFRSIVGPKFVSLDLDCVLVGDVTPLWDVDEEFVIWESMVRGQPYNGSMWLHKCGTRSEFWDDFHPIRSPVMAKKAGYVGSDQAWLSFKSPHELVWTKRDGVVSWMNHCKNRGWRLPPDSRIVFFQGIESPWDVSARQKAPWIDLHYR